MPNYPLVQVDQDIIVSTDDNNGVVIYLFEPTETATYAFYSYNNDFDTYGYILDSNMEEIVHNDDDGEGLNFKIVYNFVAGEKYYIKSTPFDDEDIYGTYTIVLAKLVAATSL